MLLLIISFRFGTCIDVIPRIRQHSENVHVPERSETHYTLDAFGYSKRDKTALMYFIFMDMNLAVILFKSIFERENTAF